MAKRPNQVLVEFEGWQLKDLETLAKAENTDRSKLVREAVTKLLAAHKASCSECGTYTWIDGYRGAEPLCGKCM